MAFNGLSILLDIDLDGLGVYNFRHDISTIMHITKLTHKRAHGRTKVVQAGQLGVRRSVRSDNNPGKPSFPSSLFLSLYSPLHPLSFSFIFLIVLELS
jgi:hypothetical protein